MRAEHGLRQDLHRLGGNAHAQAERVRLRVQRPGTLFNCSNEYLIIDIFNRVLQVVSTGQINELNEFSNEQLNWSQDHRADAGAVQPPHRRRQEVPRPGVTLPGGNVGISLYYLLYRVQDLVWCLVPWLSHQSQVGSKCGPHPA